MKRLIAVLCVAACSISPAVLADDGDKPKPQKPTPIVVKGADAHAITVTVGPDGQVSVNTPDGKKAGEKAKPAPDVQVKTICIGKVITVGPDGKIETKDIGDELPKDVLDKLPKEIREQLKEAHGQAGEGGFGIAGKVKILVDNDGKKQEFEADLTDGDAFKQLDEALKKAGTDLPPEAREAIKAASQILKGVAPKDAAQAKSPDGISAKLDKILDRLDRLEGDVKALKAQSEKRKN